MADQKITELTEDTAPVGTDLIATVDDPSGSAVTKKAQIANVLKNANLNTTAGELGGAWASWTPTLTNHTASSINGYYTQVGKTVHFYLRVVLTGVTGGMVFTAPVTADASTGQYGNDSLFHGTLEIYDSGTKRYQGLMSFGSTKDNIELKAIRSDGTYAYHTQVNATVPHTWASGDAYYASGTYEAA